MNKHKHKDKHEDDEYESKHDDYKYEDKYEKENEEHEENKNDYYNNEYGNEFGQKIKKHGISKGTVCNLINASIEEEAEAGRDYVEILEAIPKDDEYEECSKAITKILEDEINHALVLIRIGKELGCREPELSEEDEEVLGIVNHIHKIEIK